MQEERRQGGLTCHDKPAWVGFGAAPVIGQFPGDATNAVFQKLARPEGARLRFRPVMMTSFAFILGLLPLVIATGASQLARRNVGTPVFGGMIFASFLGIFAIPPLYVFFQAIHEWIRPSTRPPEKPQPEAVPTAAVHEFPRAP
jgi:AcrB/AcrD/AcrF family